MVGVYWRIHIPSVIEESGGQGRPIVLSGKVRLVFASSFWIEDPPIVGVPRPRDGIQGSWLRLRSAAKSRSSTPAFRNSGRVIRHANLSGRSNLGLADRPTSARRLLPLFTLVLGDGAQSLNLMQLRNRTTVPNFVRGVARLILISRHEPKGVVEILVSPASRMM